MPKKPDISLIICTHNRAEQLNQSLSHYLNLLEDEHYELIVVLNNCSDHSRDIVTHWQDNGLNITLLNENKEGLSHARNCGLNAAKSDWVFYIDDDAYPARDLLIQFRTTINKDIAAIAGRTKYWPDQKDSWILSEFVETPLFSTIPCLLPSNAYMSGCAMGFNKSVLLGLGGFHESFGMLNDKLAYAEEIDVQQKLQKAQHKIWYNPNLIVYHRSHLKKLSSFLHANYQKGAYLSKLRGKQVAYNFLGVLKTLVLSPLVFLTHAFKSNAKVAALKAWGPAFYHLGRLSGK